MSGDRPDASTRVTAGVAPRLVTAEEVASYQKDGWALLRRFIEPNEATALLAAAQRLMGTDGAGHTVRPEVDSDLTWWNDYHYPSRENELFASLALSESIGRSAQLMSGRQVGIRYYQDSIAVKAGHASSVRNAPTDVHQDFPAGIFDRVGEITFWIALDEVPPERGSMRFYSGSHREGPLGRMKDRSGTVSDLLATYPHLTERYALSAPLHLEPGDATCHHQLVLHGAPANETDVARWSFLGLYFPADTLYTGIPLEHPRVDALALVPNEPFDHPQFPIICP